MKPIIGLLVILLAACSSSASDQNDILLIGNKGEDTVSFIDLKSGEELTRISTSAKAPHEIAVSPDDKFAAVVNYGSAAIDILNIANREIIHTFDLGTDENPHGIVWQDDGRIFATTEGGQSMILISNANRWVERDIQSIKTNEAGTHMLAVSEDGKRAYTVNLGGGTVSLIDLEQGKVITTQGGGNQPEGIDLAKDDTELWISARGGNVVYVMDAISLKGLAKIDVGNFPLRLAITPDGTKAVTSNLRDGSLTVIDVETRKVERTIEVSGSPVSAQVTILFSDDGQHIYVAETGTDTIAEIEFASGELLRRLPAGRQGDGLAIISKNP